MNHDEKFQKIWEFRRREDDVDSSSDDSKSNSSHDPFQKKQKLLDIVLPQKNQEIDLPSSHQFNKNSVQTITASCKKKNIIKNKTSRRLIEGKKKVNTNLITQENIVTLADFKDFNDLLIDQLKVAREKMFDQMRDEMWKSKSLKSSPKTKKNVDNSRKKEPQPKSRRPKSRKQSDTNGFPKAIEEVVKNHILEATPKAQISDTHLNNSAKPGSQVEIGEILNGKNNNVGFKNSNFGFPGFQQEAQYTSFAQLTSKTTGFKGRHCSEASSIADIVFPFQLQHQRVDGSSAISSHQTFLDSSFMDDNIFTTRSKNNGIAKLNEGKSCNSGMLFPQSHDM